jgi:hypothetical protein
MINQKVLKEFFTYDKDLGCFIRIKKSGQKGFVGQLCNSKNKGGHIQISINGRTYLAHRLAWLYVYGEFPKNQIDHINCIRDDNRIINLRIATNQQNSFNRIKALGISGLKGVQWDKVKRKWLVNPVIDNKRHYLGYFNDKQNAYIAYLNFCKNNHGDFFCNKLLNKGGI